MPDKLIPSFIVLGGLGFIFSLLLAYASQKFAVKETNPKIGEITKILPGVNCGACGAANCAAFAEMIIKEKTDPNKCVVANEEIIKKIADILGIEIEFKRKKRKK